MNQDAVARLDQNVLRGVTCHNLPKRNAEHLRASVGHVSEKLPTLLPRFRRYSAGFIDRIAQMRLAPTAVTPWMMHLSKDCIFRRGLQVVSPENANRIERLQFWRAFRGRERGAERKTFDHGTGLRPH